MPETPEALPVDPFAGKAEISLAEYEESRKPAKVDEPVPPAPEGETAAEGQEPPKEAEQEKPEQQERDEKGKFRKKVEFTPEQQEAFDRAFRKREAKLRQEYEQRYAKTSEPQATQAETEDTADADGPQERPKLPKLAEFKGTIEEFDKEVAEYPDKLAKYLEHKQQIREHKKAVSARLTKSEANAKKAHPDYETEFAALKADIANDEEPALPPHVIQGIAEDADDPHEVTYYLAKNRAEFRRFATLEPHQVLREVVKLEARLSVAPAPEKPIAKPKPAPPTPVGARATSSAFDVNDEKLSPEEWAAQRNKMRRSAGHRW